MNHAEITQELAANQLVFQQLLKDVSPSMYRWKPAPDKWCLLEIICHLYDEEREDFRARLKYSLEQPPEPFVPIDPVGWVIQRQYMAQDYEKKLTGLLEERKVSVQWLEALENPNWENALQHPTLGRQSASLFLANWLAHDYIHIRQILKVKFAYLKQHSKEDLSYAGNW